MNKNKHLVLNKNGFLLLEDFSDYNRFPKFQTIDDRLHLNERFSIIIEHRNNTSRNPVAKLRKTMIYITDAGLDNDNEDTKFGFILSIRSQDTE